MDEEHAQCVEARALRYYTRKQKAMAPHFKFAKNV